MTGRPLALALLAAVVTLPCCGGGSAPPGARSVRFPAQPEGRVVTQEELQQDIQRFAGALMGRLVDVTQPILESPAAETREAVIRQFLREYSATLDIATGPTPELDLLDMAVFVQLSAGVFERHWVGVYGEPARQVAEVWKKSDAQIGQVAAKVMNEEQRGRLRSLADGWLRENPDAVYVEGVRFWEFSEIAGKISAARASETGGILGAVKAATRAGDEAVLLGERFRFLATRAPLLLRVETRLGASEVTSDALKRLAEVRTTLPSEATARSFLGELRALARDTRDTEREAKAVVDAVHPLLEHASAAPPGNLDRVINHLEGLDEKIVVLLQHTEGVLDRVHGVVPGDAKATQAALSATEARVDALARRMLLYVGALGVALTGVFWGGYVLAKLFVARRKRLHGA